MEFQFFRRFTNQQELDEVSKMLDSKNLEHLIKRPTAPLGPGYGSTYLEYFELYAYENDFVAIKTLLEQRADEIINNISSDYHLFSYSDSELSTIVSKPDEWNEIDVKLSVKILEDRRENTNTEQSYSGQGNETEPAKEYPFFDHKKHFIASYLRFYTFAIVTVFIGLFFGLHKYIYLPDKLQNNSRDLWILLGLLFVNILYYQSQYTCPKCREKLRRTLIQEYRSGDIAMPKAINVVKKFRCENCGNVWSEFINESEGD